MFYLPMSVRFFKASLLLPKYEKVYYFWFCFTTSNILTYLKYVTSEIFVFGKK
jgi:hypothetical protein